MDAPSEGQIVRLVRSDQMIVPAIIANVGEHTARRFLEFFTVNIRIKNTRDAYGRAVRQFLRWCEIRGLSLA